MNWLDFIFIGLLLLAAYAGWCLRGLIFLAVAFAVTAGPWLAQKVSPLLGPHLDPVAHGLMKGETLAFWLVLALATLGLVLLFYAASGTMEAVRLAWLDRGAGALTALFLAFCLTAFLFLDVVSRQPAPNTGRLMKASWFCTEAFPKAPHLGSRFEGFMEGLFETGKPVEVQKPKTVPGTSGHSRKKA